MKKYFTKSVIEAAFMIVQSSLFLILFITTESYSQNTDGIKPRHEVTLREAHVGDLNIDTLLLNSYGLLPDNIRQFYLDARTIFSKNKDAEFTNADILASARKYEIPLIGGPLLGNLRESGVTIWLRPARETTLVVKVKTPDGKERKSYSKDSVLPGVEQRIELNGLTPDTDYDYNVYAAEQKIAEGSFRTAPTSQEAGVFRLVFGSCFHKIGLHNPNLINQIIKRKPFAMALLGDIAVDDRENNMTMHRADYLLRDLSMPWQQLASNVPLYASWDDHDYLNNDLSGIPGPFTKTDRDALRRVWRQNWNNPVNESEGIFFNTRIGPVELIMLDTRSCRTVEERGTYGSYLGKEQLDWLKNTLKNSEAPFKVISSGTMWSDYISNGKDSWGTWDTLARQEIFQLITKENIPGVLLISGDRHGARAFKIPVTEEFGLYEFEAASLGGVPGPNAMADDPQNQLFGYDGEDIIAFGEFTFDTREGRRQVVFRLINEFGTILEEHVLSYNQLTPGAKNNN